MPLPDFYKILGVSDNAAVDEIKAAFRRLALKHHPDKNPGDKDAIEIFTAVNTAWGVLSDTDKRKEYDAKRSGTHHSIFSKSPVRTVLDLAKIRIAVDKRVVMFDEPVQVVITIFEDNSKIIVSGLNRFDVVQGPVINSLFPPGPDAPELEIAYVLRAKDFGYMEIGPASYISSGIKYISDSIYIKVNPLRDQVKWHPASKLEKIQSAVVSTLIVFYSFLIGYNVYQFKILPFSGKLDASPPVQHLPLSLGDVRLSTGAAPYASLYGKGRFDRSSFNRIILHNGKQHDAVVLLNELESKEPVRNNYIRAGEDFIMQHVPDGEYYLKVLFGNDWNDTLHLLNDEAMTGGFNRNARYEIFLQQVNIIEMQRHRTGDTLDYKIYEITLYPVEDGNAKSLSTGAEDFFN